MSKSAVNRAVFSKAVQQPFSVYPISLGLLGGFATLILGPSILTLGVMGAGIFLGLGGFATKYFMNKGEYASHYMQEMRMEMVRRREQIMQHLETDLAAVNELTGLKQIGLLREKYENLLGVLDKKMEPDELTHARYSTIAEQVFLAGLDNLQAAALALKSVGTIDIDRIAREIALNEKHDNPVSRTLKDRKDLYEKQHLRAENLLAQNELALTQLDLVTAKLANIVTNQSHAAMAIEDAMKELQHLILRTEQYSKTH